jgi:hypothetical protein
MWKVEVIRWNGSFESTEHAGGDEVDAKVDELLNVSRVARPRLIRIVTPDGQVEDTINPAVCI